MAGDRGGGKIKKTVEFVNEEPEAAPVFRPGRQRRVVFAVVFHGLVLLSLVGFHQQMRCIILAKTPASQVIDF